MTGSQALTELVAGYLNQDWPLDYATVWDAVRAFCDEEPPTVVAQARNQALQLLRSVDSEEELKRVLVDELGSGYWPPGENLTFREWLERVVSALSGGDKE